MTASAYGRVIILKLVQNIFQSFNFINHTCKFNSLSSFPISVTGRHVPSCLPLLKKPQTLPSSSWNTGVQLHISRVDVSETRAAHFDFCKQKFQGCLVIWGLFSPRGVTMILGDFKHIAINIVMFIWEKSFKKKERKKMIKNKHKCWKLTSLQILYFNPIRGSRLNSCLVSDCPIRWWPLGHWYRLWQLRRALCLQRAGHRWHMPGWLLLYFLPPPKWLEAWGPNYCDTEEARNLSSWQIQAGCPQR